jgi:outer membrane protein OmpA-like peptidoglycan-associated protein
MLEEQTMYRKLIVLLVGTALATSASAGERHRAHKAERAARHQARAANHESIGLGSGAAIGAMAGGPVGAAFGSWIGDRFHHEHDARLAAEDSGAQAHARTKTLETRLAASESAASQAGAELVAERTQHRRDLEEALSIEVLFRTEDSAIAPPTEERLAKLVAMIVPLDGAVVRLEGHTDVRGTDRYNNALATARADTVRDALIRAGMPPERIVVSAAGKADSQATDTDADGMALDRRVKMSVVGLYDTSRVAQSAQ